VPRDLLSEAAWFRGRDQEFPDPVRKQRSVKRHIRRRCRAWRLHASARCHEYREDRGRVLATDRCGLVWVHHGVFARPTIKAVYGSQTIDKTPVFAHSPLHRPAMSTSASSAESKKRARSDGVQDIKGEVVIKGEATVVSAGAADSASANAVVVAVAAVPVPSKPSLEVGHKPDPVAAVAPLDDVAWVTPILPNVRHGPRVVPRYRIEVNDKPSPAELRWDHRTSFFVKRDQLFIKSLFVTPAAHVQGLSLSVHTVNVTIVRVSDTRVIMSAGTPFFVSVSDSTVHVNPVNDSEYPEAGWITTTLAVVTDPAKSGITHLHCDNARINGDPTGIRAASLVTIVGTCLAPAVLIVAHHANVKVMGEAVLSLCSVQVTGSCFVKINHLTAGSLYTTIEDGAEFVCTNGSVEHLVANASYSSKGEFPHIVTTLRGNFKSQSRIILNSVPKPHLARESTETRRAKLNTATNRFEFLDE
jgi:hypothetical protein